MTVEAKMRWSKWWWGDWRSDPALRMCSYAARGLWMDMLTIMAEADPVGHLVVAGRGPTPRQIASMTGGTEKEATRLLAELEEAAVFSRTADGVIFSRRMVRDKAASDEARENGRLGGNPTLKPKAREKSKEHKAEDKRGVNPPVQPTLILEAEAESESKIQKASPSAAVALFDDAASVSGTIATTTLPPTVMPIRDLLWRDGMSSNGAMPVASNGGEIAEHSPLHHRPLTDMSVSAHRMSGQMEDGEEKEKKEKIQKASPSAAEHAVAIAASGVAPIRDLLWRDGIPILRDLLGKADGASRAFLGRLLKSARDDCALVHRVLREAHDLRPADPGAWLVAACIPPSERAGGDRQRWRDPRFDHAADLMRDLAGPPIIDGEAA